MFFYENGLINILCFKRKLIKNLNYYLKSVIKVGGFPEIHSLEKKKQIHKSFFCMNIKNLIIIFIFSGMLKYKISIFEFIWLNFFLKVDTS